MPNRIIKESIRTSKSINALTDFQFRLWVYLITYVDDYGRGSADPEILKGFVFPRRKRVSESDIEKSLAELAGMGCINLYNVDGESYFCFPNWGDHQRIQTKKSKFPEPSSTECNVNPRKSTVDHGESPPESESKSESKSEAESESIDSAEQGSALLPAYELPLVDSSMHGITKAEITRYTELYPAVDVMQALRSMRGWLDANPKKRKTKAGIKKFVNGWLEREQNRGGNTRSSAGSGNVFADMARERRWAN